MLTDSIAEESVAYQGGFRVSQRRIVVGTARNRGTLGERQLQRYRPFYRPAVKKITAAFVTTAGIRLPQGRRCPSATLRRLFRSGSLRGSGGVAIRGEGPAGISPQIFDAVDLQNRAAFRMIRRFRKNGSRFDGYSFDTHFQKHIAE